MHEIIWCKAKINFDFIVLDKLCSNRTKLYKNVIYDIHTIDYAAVRLFCSRNLKFCSIESDKSNTWTGKAHSIIIKKQKDGLREYVKTHP